MGNYIPVIPQWKTVATMFPATPSVTEGRAQPVEHGARDRRSWTARGVCVGNPDELSIDGLMGNQVCNSHA